MCQLVRQPDKARMVLGPVPAYNKCRVKKGDAPVRTHQMSMFDSWVHKVAMFIGGRSQCHFRRKTT